jgi:hypothetical protein
MSPKLGSPGLSGWGVCHGSSNDFRFWISHRFTMVCKAGRTVRG